METHLTDTYLWTECIGLRLAPLRRYRWPRLFILASGPPEVAQMVHLPRSRMTTLHSLLGQFYRLQLSPVPHQPLSDLVIRSRLSAQILAILRARAMSF